LCCHAFQAVELMVLRNNAPRTALHHSYTNNRH
jgi:hypothetical protein